MKSVTEEMAPFQGESEGTLSVAMKGMLDYLLACVAPEFRSLGRVGINRLERVLRGHKARAMEYFNQLRHLEPRSQAHADQAVQGST